MRLTARAAATLEKLGWHRHPQFIPHIHSWLHVYHAFALCSIAGEQCFTINPSYARAGSAWSAASPVLYSNPCCPVVLYICLKCLRIPSQPHSISRYAVLLAGWPPSNLQRPSDPKTTPAEDIIEAATFHLAHMNGGIDNGYPWEGGVGRIGEGGVPACCTESGEMDAMERCGFDGVL
jgi:hypothetical protein